MSCSASSMASGTPAMLPFAILKHEMGHIYAAAADVIRISHVSARAPVLFILALTGGPLISSFILIEIMNGITAAQ